MSDVNIAVIQQAFGTTGGNVSFTSSGFGTCKGYLLILSKITTVDTIASHAHICVGGGDGTNEWLAYGSSEDAIATTNTNRKAMEDHSIFMGTPGGSRDGWATFNAFVTDGIELNVDNTFDGDYQLTVILLGGDDLSVDAGVWNPNATQNLTTTVTTGFETNALFVFSVGRNSDTGSAPLDILELSKGLLSYDGTTIRQAFSVINEADNAAAGEPSAQASASRVQGAITSESLDYTTEITSVTSTTFVATTRDGGADASDDICYLALNLPSDMEAWVGVVDSATSTGSEAYTPTGLSVKGQFLLQIQTLIDTLDSLKTDSQAGGVGIGVSTASASFSHSINIEDAAATTNTQSWIETDSVAIEDDDGTALLQASFTSFDSAGWTQNYSAADGTARKFPSLIIQEEPAVGGATPKGPLGMPLHGALGGPI